ncbi:MAG TPA: HEAT repeat domain-containing protein, partial [Longimicrobium sp.]
RNVAVALGNWGSPDAVPALALALNDEEALVRGHAAWALGRIGTEAARQALSGRAEVEEDAWVREEIAAADRALDSAGRVAPRSRSPSRSRTKAVAHRGAGPWPDLTRV